jgi:hypothetical protein
MMDATDARKPDDKHGASFDRLAKGVGIRVIKRVVRAPDMNAVAERFVGSECQGVSHTLSSSESPSWQDSCSQGYITAAEGRRDRGRRRRMG